MKKFKLFVVLAVIVFATTQCRRSNTGLLPTPSADFDVPGGQLWEKCPIQFINNSEHSTSYLWDFGDGNTSIEAEPIHSYSNPGTYTVQLTASDDETEEVHSETIQIYQVTKFKKIVEGIYGNSYKTIQLSPNGGYAIAYDISDSGTNTVSLAKIDSDGNYQSNISTEISGFVTAMLKDADKYIVTGGAPTGGYLAKIDAGGNIDWNKSFGGDIMEVNSLKNDTDGGYILAGTNAFFRPVIGKTDAIGNLLWHTPFTEMNGECYDIIITDNGEYITAGWKEGIDSLGMTHWYTFMAKTNMSGNIEWERTFDGPPINSISQTDDNGYIFAGGIIEVGSNAYIVKTDLNGNRQWEKHFPDAGALSIVNTFDNGYIWTGFQGTSDVYMVKIDKNGNTQWEKIFDIGGVAYFTIPTEDCGYMTIVDRGNQSLFPYLIKTDAEGNAN